jgi:thioesterase domain-containing protein
LRASGESVGLLAIIDHWLSPNAREDRSAWSALVHGVRNVPLWIRDDLLPSGREEIAGRIRSRTRALWSSASRRLPGRARPSRRDIRDELGMWRFPDEVVGMLEKLHDAFRRYAPRPYAGRVAVFKPRTMPLGFHRLRHDLGWSDLATGGVDVATVPGSHGTMLKEPLVRHLAAALGAALDRAAAADHPSGHAAGARRRQNAMTTYAQ